MGPADKTGQLFLVGHPGDTRGIDRGKSIAGDVQLGECPVGDRIQVAVAGDISHHAKLRVFRSYVLRTRLRRTARNPDPACGQKKA